MDDTARWSNPASRRLPDWAIVVSLALWLTLCLGAITIVVTLNIREVEQDLTQYGDAYSDHLNKEMISSETILKGFAALFGAVGNTDPVQVSRYVRRVIESNPHIFALEIVERVPGSQLVKFVALKRRTVDPDFTVKSFSYDYDRKWQPLKEKPFYYPIVFMEPMLTGSEDVLGLDVDSVPFLQQAMHESIQRRRPVASYPFNLVEGNLAYVVFSPIPQTYGSDGAPTGPTTQDRLLVDMVIDAATLAAPIKLPVFDGGTISIHHKDFSPDDRKGQLLGLSGTPRTPVETLIFPAFVYSKPLATMGEPFALKVSRQVGWSDLSLGLLALLALLSILSTLLLTAYLRKYRQAQNIQAAHQKLLWHLANHDVLTGLPNRMLLLDRMEQLLARMRRRGMRLAVMFLDLDDFKQVNDTYGHEAGDQLLKVVAERLRGAVRMDDTVARLSGDEFIILVENVEDLAALETVRQKIQLALSEGFQIKGHLLAVQTSFGVAMFPEDGDSPEALIKQADNRMYADKQSRTGDLKLA